MDCTYCGETLVKWSSTLVMDDGSKVDQLVCPIDMSDNSSHPSVPSVFVISGTDTVVSGYSG